MNNKMQLGDIHFEVQNEKEMNADYYVLDGNYKELQDRKQLEQEIAQMSEPERLTIHQDGRKYAVASRQPDAMVELAMHFNRQRGVQVSKQEVVEVRKRLIRMQREDH